MRKRYVGTMPQKNAMTKQPKPLVGDQSVVERERLDRGPYLPERFPGPANSACSVFDLVGRFQREPVPEFIYRSHNETTR
jgi:hypothetical protein